MAHRPNERFGPTLTDKSEFEERIRRAQLAILNPSRKASDFLGTLGLAGSDMPNELSFSADLISVSISGHGDDLSFVDLPGWQLHFPLDLSHHLRSYQGLSCLLRKMVTTRTSRK
jgi:hypothetical protein